MSKSGLFYLCNRLEGIFFISEGIHALGNLTLNSATKKIESIKNDFNQILHEGFVHLQRAPNNLPANLPR